MKLIETQDVQQKMLNGINKVADIVGSTLGPKGTNVILDKHYGDPVVTNDGVTIAKEIELEDPIENVGAKLIIQVAKAADKTVGDGTTTATVIAKALASEGLRHITAGSNPIFLQKGMIKALEIISKELEEKAIKIESYDDYYHVAFVSSGGNEEVSSMIANAIAKVGPKGIIQAEEAQGSKSSLHITEGIEFEPGFMSPYFVTDREKNIVSYQDTMILIMDHVLSDIRPIVPYLQHASQNNLKTLIIADDVEQEALQSLVMNKMQNVLQVCAVKAPSFGEKRKDVLKDIAVMVGAKVFSYEDGTQVSESFKPENLEKALEGIGAAKSIKVTDKKTIISNGAYDEEVLVAHIKSIEDKIADETTDEADKEWLEERLAMLHSAMGIIRVGGVTQVQQKELMLRVEDAINSTKAAAESGVLPGGGVGLLIAKNALAKAIADLGPSEQMSKVDADTKLGMILVENALVKPIERIVANSGNKPDVILNKIQEIQTNEAFENGVFYGYDAYTDSIVDMMEAGVIDPAKVTISSVQNAISVVSTLISSGSVIIHVPEKN